MLLNLEGLDENTTMTILFPSSLLVARNIFAFDDGLSLDVDDPFRFKAIMTQSVVVGWEWFWRARNK
jgi:hypothetical protein